MMYIPILHAFGEHPSDPWILLWLNYSPLIKSTMALCNNSFVRHNLNVMIKFDYNIYEVHTKMVAPLF